MWLGGLYTDNDANANIDTHSDTKDDRQSMII